jgi:hypothetical protein
MPGAIQSEECPIDWPMGMGVTTAIFVGAIADVIVQHVAAEAAYDPLGSMERWVWKDG